MSKERSMKLSAGAIGVCRRNYKNNCGRCPIRPACIATFGHGQEGLDEWRKKVNMAVIRYMDNLEAAE